ncbi:hypothetical protein SAMN04488490_4139 [Marinobacter sp. LV10R510-11A]|uniref:DUF2059 domain-containing protein n=1 Tax=Marinobacter sp. LV10R510-11A TaxID=1415568 RepID=UPI000BB7B936|nr:DUF2059 domain-containing protein [Marinobacter sp. LV10R510-11A]SOB78275.1 hypothetical protein SAMN04488490_4139 [Marinobacter sp. LV10R510-11A]
MKLGTLVKPLLITGLFLAGPAMAAPSAQQVLSASPIDDIVDRYPAMMSEGIREGLKRNQQLPPMVADTIGYVVTNSFRAADIEQQIVKNLERDLSGKQLEAVESWYKTPVAKKISAAEVAASDPAAWRQIQARAPELNKKYKGTDRAQTFERFDRAARATESAVDTTIAVQLGLATAMAAFSSDSENYDALKQNIENQRGQIRGVVEQQVYDSYLHTYEKISAQEMGLYIDFLESGPGSAFSKTVTQSIQQAITDPIESIGNQMARFLSPQK